MIRRVQSAVAVALVVALAGCAPVLTEAARNSNILAAADALAAYWGGDANSSRQALARQQLRAAMTDPNIADAWRAKPMLVSDESYGMQLEREGFAMLSDQALQRAASLRLRMLMDATAEECSSYVALNASGAWMAPEGAAWRRRLARVSDDDFAQSLQLSLQAIAERARRLNEPAFMLSEAEQQRAFGELVVAVPKSIRDEMFSASKSNSEPKPSDLCRFVVELLRVQATSSGNALRVGLTPASR